MMNKRDKTKQYIIEKTASIFNKKGYSGTSMADLTKATGLTKGSIYGNFKNKDDVAIHAFKYNLNQIFDKFGIELSEKLTSIDKLLVFPKVYKHNAETIFNNGGCPILNTSTEADDTNNLLKKFAQKAINSWRKTLEDIIIEGKRKNEIRKEVNEKEFAGIIISLIEGSGMLAKITGENDYFFNAIDLIENKINNEIKV